MVDASTMCDNMRPLSRKKTQVSAYSMAKSRSKSGLGSSKASKLTSSKRSESGDLRAAEEYDDDVNREMGGGSNLHTEHMTEIYEGSEASE